MTIVSRTIMKEKIKGIWGKKTMKLKRENTPYEIRQECNKNPKLDHVDFRNSIISWKPANRFSTYKDNSNMTRTFYVFVCNMAKTSRIRVSTENIIYKEMKYRKVCATWIPKQLSVEQKHQKVQVSTHLLNRFHQEGKSFPILRIGQTFALRFPSFCPP